MIPFSSLIIVSWSMYKFLIVAVKGEDALLVIILVIMLKLKKHTQKMHFIHDHFQVGRDS